MATTDKKLVRSRSGLRMVSMTDNKTSSFTLPEPEWVPDNDCGYCMQRSCQSKFDFIRRRHHCRRCGNCFCNSCCDNKLPLPRMSFVDPVRQCNKCAEITKKENEFFDKHVKLLLSGGEFMIAEGDDDGEISTSYICKLATDQRYLVFEGEHSKMDSIGLDEIDTVKVIASEPNQQGFKVGTGVAIRHKDSFGDYQILKMEIKKDESSKSGKMWIAAMLKAFRLIMEARTGKPCNTPVA
ncbi:hypothetical protein SNE40_009055 [Patella caerulea]|uniref:FYVE-type domain-containing protein n=1 Tax=Patella caerulea TaxID=87958 RepID=A0AAN8JNF3_PATCE